jgi:hypothetical protein
MEKQKSKNFHKYISKTRLQNLNLFEIIIDYFTKINVNDDKHH